MTIQTKYQVSRGDGTTSRQLLEAPRGAIYICSDQRNAEYTRRLAHHLGRHDISCKTPEFFRCGWQGNRGLKVIIDHFAMEAMTNEQRDMAEIACSYLEARQ